MACHGGVKLLFADAYMHFMADDKREKKVGLQIAKSQQQRENITIGVAGLILCRKKRATHRHTE